MVIMSKLQEITTVMRRNGITTDLEFLKWQCAVGILIYILDALGGIDAILDIIPTITRSPDGMDPHALHFRMISFRSSVSTFFPTTLINIPTLGL